MTGGTGQKLSPGKKSGVLGKQDERPQEGRPGEAFPSQATNGETPKPRPWTKANRQPKDERPSKKGLGNEKGCRDGLTIVPHTTRHTQRANMLPGKYRHICTFILTNIHTLMGMYFP